MKLFCYAAALVIGIGALTACSSTGGNQQTTAGAKSTVAGKVADGYLSNAVVFLDKNANYQLDANEPTTTTDQTGSFTLSIDPVDVGRYPIVVLAVKDQTVDLDTHQAVANTYVLSIHAVSVTATTNGSLTGMVSNFISPISTLIREVLEANPGMTFAEASAQVRNQLNIPANVRIHGDYIFGSYSGNNRSDYQRMHQVAQEMAGIMGEQSDLVMNDRTPQLGRYRQMLGQIGNNLPQIRDNLNQGVGWGSSMNAIHGRIRNSVAGGPASARFRNISSLFNNMTSHDSFWNMSGGAMRPHNRHQHQSRSQH